MKRREKAHHKRIKMPLALTSRTDQGQLSSNCSSNCSSNISSAISNNHCNYGSNIAATAGQPASPFLFLYLPIKLSTF